MAESITDEALPPSEWIWDELKQCGAVDSNRRWFTDLQGDIHPLFSKQRWIGISQERYDALQQSFILGTKLLQVGGQYLCNFLPADRMKRQLTAFMSPTRHHRLPIHLGWSSEDILEAFEELENIAEHVQWKESTDMWPRRGLNCPTADHSAVETQSSPPLEAVLKTATEEAWIRACIRAKAANQLHCSITIYVASQFVDAVLHSKKNSEKHMVALFASSINLIRELGNTIVRHRTDWDQQPLWVGKDVVANPGDSMIAWLFDGWLPEINYLSSEKTELELETGMCWSKMPRTPIEKPKALFFYSIPLKHIQRIMSHREWNKLSSPSQNFARIRYDLLCPSTPFRAGEHARKGNILSEDAWINESVMRDFRPSRGGEDYRDEDWDCKPVSFSRKRQRDTDDDVKEAGSGGRDVKRHEHSSYDLDSPDHEDVPEWFTKGNSLPSEDDTVLDFINEQNHMPGELLPNAPPREDKDYYDIHDQSDTPIRRVHFIEYMKEKEETIRVMNKCLSDAFKDYRKAADEAAEWRQKFEDLEATNAIKNTSDIIEAEVTAIDSTVWKKKYEDAKEQYEYEILKVQRTAEPWQRKCQDVEAKVEKMNRQSLNRKILLEMAQEEKGREMRRYSKEVDAWRQKYEDLELQSAQNEIITEQNLNEATTRYARAMADLQKKYQDLKAKSSLEKSSTQEVLNAVMNSEADLKKKYDEAWATLESFAKQPSGGTEDVAYWQKQFADGFLRWAKIQAEMQHKERELEEKARRELAHEKPKLQEQQWQEDIDREYPLPEIGDIEENLKRRLAKAQAKKMLLEQLDGKLRKRW